MQPVPMPARISDSQNDMGGRSGLSGRRLGLAEPARLQTLSTGGRGCDRLGVVLALDHRAVGPVVTLPAGKGQEAHARRSRATLGCGLTVGREDGGVWTAQKG